MFNGSYYADILVHELKGKPYNKKWLYFKHKAQAVLVLLLAIAVLYIIGQQK